MLNAGIIVAVAVSNPSAVTSQEATAATPRAPTIPGYRVILGDVLFMIDLLTMVPCE